MYIEFSHVPTLAMHTSQFWSGMYDNKLEINGKDCREYLL